MTTRGTSDEMTRAHGADESPAGQVPTAAEGFAGDLALLLAKDCPAFASGCPYKTNLHVAEWVEANHVSALQNCPAFQNGCPFRDVLDSDVLSQQLQKLPPSHMAYDWLAVDASNGGPAMQLSPEQSLVNEFFHAVHCASMSVKEAVGGDCARVPRACPFRQIRKNEHVVQQSEFLVSGALNEQIVLEHVVGTPSDVRTSSAAARFVKILQGWSGYAVVGMMLLAALGSLPFALRLGSTTTTRFSPAPGSKSAFEEKAFLAEFPGVFDDRETVYLHCDAPADCACRGQRDCSGFENVIRKFAQSLKPFSEDGTLATMFSYFDLQQPELEPLDRMYYDAATSSMIVTLSFRVDKETRFVAAVQAAVDASAQLTGGGWTVAVSGQEAAMLSSSAAIKKSMMISENIGMIFIVLLFGWQIRSWRLVLIPLLNTLICLVVSDALLYPLSASGLIVVPSYVPKVCLFLAIALSVDYSFFHLSRFQEVRRAGGDFNTAVIEMVAAGGRVVLVSGVVLMFCWLALAAFPVFGTDSLGYAASITIFVCIVVNLTMNPAMVLIFHRFFSKASHDPWRCCRRRAGQGDEGVSGQPLVASILEGSLANNVYGKIAKQITKSPWFIVVPLLVYALLIPAAVRFFDATLIVGGLNGHSASTNSTADHILADFPTAGGGAPLMVLLTPPASTLVESDAYFAAGCELSKILQGNTKLAPEAFNGVWIRHQTHDMSCYTWGGADGAAALLATNGVYAWSWPQAVNAGNTSTMLSVTPPFDPFTSQAKALVDQARAAMETFMNQPGHEGWTAVSYHPMSVNVDAEELASNRFPWVVALTAGVVFCVVGLRYGALLVPVKLIFTIALPILAVLGVDVFIFQDGAMNWTRIPSLQSSGGVVWINPLACTFMLIGFGLDYDIFLFSRIYSTRKSGEFANDRDAIVDAVAATGPVITTAGVIMALAFVGMVAQHDTELLCQMGWTMIFGVLMDTFVVRMLLVPCMLVMAGDLNWWPAKMPGLEEASNPDLSVV